MNAVIDYLNEQKIDDGLVHDLMEYRKKHEVDDRVKDRVYTPDMLFYGKKILEMSIAALLEKENLLLSGPKATGKNVLCETLSYLFGRPSYNISFHVNTDSASLIGTDTFKNNEVQLRTGPIYQCAQYGGIGILDEINMAKMMPCLCCMLLWITGESLMYPAIRKWRCIRQQDLSEQ